MATKYNPYAQTSGTDPRGRLQNQGAYQQQRYESQQGPLANQFAYMTGRANEADYGNYTDIMNQYRGIASGGGKLSTGVAKSGGGGGGGGAKAPAIQKYTAFTYNPAQHEAAQAQLAADPFKSYEGFTDFSTTGGFSPQDIANMRARGISPIRAAYANAERNVGQQRALQGGYAPNAIAAQAKMAREQGQLTADATQNVEAELAQQRQQGRLAGLAGMSGIEGQRYAAGNEMNMYNTGQLNQVGMFNVGESNEGSQFNSQAQSQAQAANIQAAERARAAARAASNAAANRRLQSAQYDTQNQLAALSGMRTLYGTTPGMSELFGNQAISTVGQGGNFGLGSRRQDALDQNMPGQYDTTMGRVRDIGGLVGQGLNVYNDIRGARKKKPAYEDEDPYRD